MSNSGEQLDKGSLRLFITKNQKNESKRQHKRRLRAYSKNIDNENPKHNRYIGGWSV